MIISLNTVVSELNSNDNFLIISHADPDGDTIGSSFALYLALKQLGKNAKIKCNDEFHHKYNYLTSCYDGEDFEEQYVITADVADSKLLGDSMNEYVGKIDLAIDHHSSHREFAKMTYVDSDASSASLVVYDIVSQLGVKITKDMANAIYTGLATDTGCFKFSNTTPKAHNVAAVLFEKGADYEFINRIMFETKTAGRMQLEKFALDSLQLFCDGKCALIVITQDMLKQTDTAENDLDGIVSIPRQIEGVEVGISIREKANQDSNESEKQYKISLRTNCEVDAAEVCAVFNGGGHKRAAGCVINGKINDVIKKLIATVEKYI